MSSLSTKFLPEEIVFEILSWLPAKHVVTCKCVCKQWYNLIEDRFFVIIHRSRSLPVSVCCEDRVESLDVDGTIIQETFRTMSVFAGLIAEKGDISRKYRLRNLTTQEIVYLPRPHKGTFIITSTDDYYSSAGIKLVSMYGKRKSAIKGFQVLNLDRDDKWRRLKFPTLKHHKRRQRQPQGTSPLLIRKNTFNHIKRVGRGSKKHIEVYSYDMERECCFSNTLPRGLVSEILKGLFSGWKECLAMTDIEEENLHVTVLEYYRKLIRMHMWSESKIVHHWSEAKIIIPLTFLKENQDMKTQQVPFSLYIGTFSSKKVLFLYDTQSREITQVSSFYLERRYKIRPSVLTFKRNAIGEDTNQNSTCKSSQMTAVIILLLSVLSYFMSMFFNIRI